MHLIRQYSWAHIFDGDDTNFFFSCSMHLDPKCKTASSRAPKQQQQQQKSINAELHEVRKVIWLQERRIFPAISSCLPYLFFLPKPSPNIEPPSSLPPLTSRHAANYRSASISFYYHPFDGGQKRRWGKNCWKSGYSGLARLPSDAGEKTTTKNKRFSWNIRNRYSGKFSIDIHSMIYILAQKSTLH